MHKEPPHSEPRLPVHGFVLAGGQSSRMGTDKTLLLFRGRPMVEIAVEKLRTFCSAVSIAGNREDLSRFAPVVPESRRNEGPVAGIEAGLQACTQPWALFLPVDVPLLPAQFLRQWAEAVLADSLCEASYLAADGREQPIFCLLRPAHLSSMSEALAGGECRVRNLLRIVAGAGAGRALRIWDAQDVAGALLDPEYPQLQIANWFRNVNTPDELSDAEVAVGAV